MLLCLLLPGRPAGGQPPPAAPPAGAKTHRMEVLGVAADPATGQPMVILRSLEDRRELTMFIGPFEAQGIAFPLQGVRLPRPYTHDLIGAILRRLDTQVEKVVITDLRDNTYFATLTLRSQGRAIELDSRPSDAIAIALREKVPILAEERVLQAAGPGGRAGQGAPAGKQP